MPPAHARVNLTRTGGFAGIATRATVDTAELDPPEAERVLAGLDAVDLPELAARAPAPPGPPDSFRYELEVERGGGTHRIALAQHEVPDALRPVLDVLGKHARPVRDG
jgi:hypothetical protein